MNVRAYYNEMDPAAAQVLRELIARGVIAPGDVDERSIKDVTPDDITGYTQCHFFAGGGLWSVAARLAGWPDDRPLWTGSCPCQPFSAAGKQLGTDDPRHLWPDFHRLIGSCRPAVVMGEQVAGAAGYDWFDGVRSDLESEGYQGRAVDIPACAVDAPHQRNRLYWIALDNRIGARLEGQRGDGSRGEGRSHSAGSIAATDGVVFGNTESVGRRERWPEHELRGRRDAVACADVQLQPNADSGGCEGWAESTQRVPIERAATEWSADELLADTAGERRDAATLAGVHQGEEGPGPWNGQPQRPHGPPLRNGSWWADAEWIVSPLDKKARRAKPGIPFLVDGLPGRVDLWRVGGNAIVPILAAEVIAAFLETE